MSVRVWQIERRPTHDDLLQERSVDWRLPIEYGPRCQKCDGLHTPGWACLRYPRVVVEEDC